MKKVSYALILMGVFALLSAAPTYAKDQWLQLRSKNFNVISNAGEGETQKLVLKLEQFRFVFSKLVKTQNAAPITVVVFKNDGSYKPFKPLYNGKPANVAGYFQRSQDDNLITLNIAANDTRPLAVIFHEYTHFLTSRLPRPLPLWLNEGIAELYSSFEVEKNKVILGAPIDNHVLFLREKKFLPFRSLFTVRHGSAEYNERDKQGVFYAQSWALAHYLMFGDRMARQPQLVRFVDLLNAGVDGEEAFRQAFQVTPEAMEKSLRDYIGRDSYTIVERMMESTEGEKNIAVRPLSEAESQYYLGNILLQTDRVDEAETYFKRAMELDAALATPYEGLGFVAMRRNQYAEAETYFKQASERDSKNYMARYYYAETLNRKAMAGGGSLMTPQVAQKIVDELKASINLEPNFAHSYGLLGYVRLVSGEKLEEGARYLNAALQLEPQNQHFRLNLGQLQMRLQDFAAAKKTLEPLAQAADDDGMKQTALTMIQRIDDYQRARASNSTPGESSSVTIETTSPEREMPQLQRRVPSKEATGPAAPPVGEPASTVKENPSARPSLRIADAEILRGVLTAIECGDGMVLVFRSGDKVLRFSATDPVKLQFFSKDPSISVNIGCGPINIPAFVFYKPLNNQSPFTGDAVAVEFTK